jgi:uncharacterized protein (DUF58 family)
MATRVADRGIEVRRGIEWSRLASLKIRARMVADGVYAGAHRSARKGAGVEFGGHRAYTPGDDLRWLDVRSLLRHDHLLVRQFETETDRALRLVVDASASMGYPRGGTPTKLAWTSVVAAALARIAVRNGDPVGLSFLGGKRSGFGVPLSGGREAFERVVDALEGQAASGDLTSDDGALDRGLLSLARSARRGSVLVVLSDLLDLPAGSHERLSALSTRGRIVVVVQVLDPAEATFPFDETVRLRALEGDASVETGVDGRAGYLEALASLQDRFRKALLARGGTFLSMSTDQDPVHAVRQIIEAIQ